MTNQSDNPLGLVLVHHRLHVGMGESAGVDGLYVGYVVQVDPLGDWLAPETLICSGPRQEVEDFLKPIAEALHTEVAFEADRLKEVPRERV